MKREYKPLSRCLDNYFNVYLSNVRGASKNTRRAYRDAFMLFFCFLSKHTNTPIDKLTFKEITKDNVLEFLDYLEKDKKNTTKTRNHRFTVIRCFICYMMQCDPMNMKQWSDIAEIPKKKERKIFRRILIELLIIFQTDYAQTATVKSGKITIFEKPANRVRTIIKNSSILYYCFRILFVMKNFK